jgi:hypothetical protein
VSVAAIFFISAGYKVVSPRATFDVLHTVWGFPTSLADGGVAMAGAVETMVAVSVLVSRWKGLRFVVAGLLLLLMVSPLYQLLTSSQLHCGCMPVPALTPTQGNALAVGRNALLAIWVLRSRNFGLSLLVG